MVEKAYGLFLLEKAKEGKYGELLVRKSSDLIGDSIEKKYIYNTEDEQMEHRKLMESQGYECYQCGVSTLYKDYDLKTNSDSFFKYDVKVPTSTFGGKKDGLLHEARLRFGYYKEVFGNVFVGKADWGYFIDLQCSKEHLGQKCSCKNVDIVEHKADALKIGREEASRLDIPLVTDWD